MPDRVLFPESGFTKADAVDYYVRIAKVMLPHLKNRPVSFKRYPASVRDESFWEKDAPSFTPAWVKRFAVPRKRDESEIEYIVINDARTLKWVAEIGGIELHPFLHRIPKIDVATQVVFDLDPGPGADIADCCRVALLLRDALRAIDLESFAKVSGSKGLQVYVPLNTSATHDATEPFARMVAEELARAHPKLVTAKMSKQFRAKKVFIDWSQNAGYKTTVAVYSLRAKSAKPYVSMPVTWEEVRRAKKLYWEPREALARVQKVGDLWKETLTLKQKLAIAAPPRASTPPRVTRAKASLPRAKSQSGRRLFLVTKTESGNELWLDMHGKFKRWILRPDREGTRTLIALPAGDFAIDPAYYRAEVPDKYKATVTIADAGSFEVIEGSYAARRFALWFSGKVMDGRWTLEKISEEPQHRSWRLAPAFVSSRA